MLIYTNDVYSESAEAETNGKMTMLPYFMPTYGEATTLSGILALTTSAAIVWRLRRYVTWQRLWPILLTSDYCFGLGGVIIGTALGGYVFKHIPNQAFRYVVYAYIGVSGMIILLTNC